MNTLLDQVERNLFEESDLNLDRLQGAIQKLQRFDIDYSDIFIQEVQHQYWQLEDGIVKDASFNLNKGLGVRAIEGEKTSFAYANQLQLQALDNAISAASSMSRSGQHKTISFNAVASQPLYTSRPVLFEIKQQQKIDLLRSLDAKARQLDDKVQQVVVSLSAVDEQMMVLASDGVTAADIRPMIRLNVSVIVEHQGRRERGSAGLGGRYDWLQLMQADLDGLAKTAVTQALINLEAIDAPAGMMPVVLGNGWPGVLLHEAVGHGLEGDFNRKGSSAYANKIGQQVASELCTVVDDGSLPNHRGSLTVDDEGTSTQSTMLIEKGVLKGYMQDKHNARLMGQKPTGNGRRESYAHLPMPRMTNTFMKSGDSDPEEIIKSVKKGIYAPNFAGGQVDITSGNFVFSASEAYLIEDGKITAPIKGATLTGNGPEVLKRVSMVGNDSSLDPGIGVCGKDGQSIPVCVGQPTLKVDQMTVGGTKA